MRTPKFELKTGDNVAYLYLPDNPRSPGCIAKTVRLIDIFPGVIGPDIYLDLDSHGKLIGIEILE